MVSKEFFEEEKTNSLLSHTLSHTITLHFAKCNTANIPMHIMQKDIWLDNSLLETAYIHLKGY